MTVLLSGVARAVLPRVRLTMEPHDLVEKSSSAYKAVALTVELMGHGSPSGVRTHNASTNAIAIECSTIELSGNGADGEDRTRTSKAQRFLRPSRMPIPPHRHNNECSAFALIFQGRIPYSNQTEACCLSRTFTEAVMFQENADESLMPIIYEVTLISSLKLKPLYHIQILVSRITTKKRGK